EACGKLEQIKETIDAVKGSDINVFSGDDGLAIEIIKLGGRGLISVASNLIPQQMHDMTTLALTGDVAGAEKMSKDFAPLFAQLFSEVNPIPIKYACSQKNLCKNILRLPLTPMSEDKAQLLLGTMQQFKLI
ncbi:MAG: dihydrodipicolinate synthase family protein, partial [Clostridia bacterium]